MWDNPPGSLPLSSANGRGCQNNATLLAFAPHGSQHCGTCAHLPIPSLTQGSSDCTDCQGYLVIYGPSWTLMDISAEGPMSPMASASSLGFNSFADTFLFKSSPHAWWKLNGCFLPEGEPCVTDGVPVLPWHPVHGTNGCHWWRSQTHWSPGLACTAGWGTCLITFVIVANVMSIQKDSQSFSQSFFSTPFPQRRFICAFLHLLRFAYSTFSLLSNTQYTSMGQAGLLGLHLRWPSVIWALTSPSGTGAL